jgi:hypothetical protein
MDRARGGNVFTWILLFLMLLMAVVLAFVNDSVAGQEVEATVQCAIVLSIAVEAWRDATIPGWFRID